jgi:hypothetical protein
MVEKGWKRQLSCMPTKVLSILNLGQETKLGLNTHKLAIILSKKSFG